MIRLIIEVPDEEIELLFALLPKLGARVIARVQADDEKSPLMALLEPSFETNGKLVWDTFELTEERQRELLALCPNSVNKGNSDIGKLAVEIVRDYFKYKTPTATVRVGGKGIDLKGADMEINFDGKTDRFEIKGTVSSGVAWERIKVSGKPCYDNLVNGMTMIRVCDSTSRSPKLYFLKYGLHFTMRREPRWSVYELNTL